VKVYLIDDDSEESDLFSEALERIDPTIEFKWFDNVIEAFDFILKEQPMPDVLFLDLNLPQVSGKQFLKLLRENRATKTLPVVIYSTSIAKKDIEDTSPYVVKSYLQKPENFEMLCANLKKLVVAHDDSSSL